MNKIIASITCIAQLLLTAADDQRPVVLFQIPAASQTTTGIAISRSGEHIAYVSACEKTPNRIYNNCDGSYCIQCGESCESPFSSAPFALTVTETALTLLTVSNNAQPEIKKQRLYRTEGKVTDVIPQLAGPVAFSDDGTLLAAGMSCKMSPAIGEIRLWQIPAPSDTSLNPVKAGLNLIFDHPSYSDTLQIAPSANAHLCFDPDGKRIASIRSVFHHLAHGSCVFVHDLTSNALITKGYTLGTGKAGQCSFNVDGTLCAAQTENTISLWDLRSPNKNVTKSMTLPNQTDTAFGMSPDNKTIYASSQLDDGSEIINIIDLTTNQISEQLPLPDNGTVPASGARTFEIVEPRRQARHAHKSLPGNNDAEFITGRLSADKRTLVYDSKDNGLRVAISHKPFGDL